MERVEHTRRELTIGLINNMPDSALLATERQFLSLLNSASRDISIRLSLYSLPGVPRSEASARRIARLYSSTESLRGMRLDGLIVTGRESMARDLADEPYWESFGEIVEWARCHTYSTIWSCLAAHAAVQYLEGIKRIRDHRKHCGVFDCERVSDHPITRGTPARFRVPHSRWNNLRAEDLAQSGYQVLTHTSNSNVDAFLKEEESLFVFFQGHPEYESKTLLLEYRRDVARYLRRETGTYPSIPMGYLDRDTMAALNGMEVRARSHRAPELLPEVNRILERASVEQCWRTTAVQIYGNWLDYILAEKERREPAGPELIGRVDKWIPSVFGADSSARGIFLAR